MQRPLLCAFAAALVLSAACGPGDRDAATPSPDGHGTPEEAGEEVAEIEHQEVTLYFPAPDAQGLVPVTHRIFETAAPGDRAKQILGALLRGPSGRSALPAVPAGTELRQVFVMEDGTAYADFSSELQGRMGGGSAVELNTVYAIVNSLALNVGEIRTVAILVEGQQVESLNGHMDLLQPLPPRRDLVVGAKTSSGTTATPP